jgi:hypothetical protein
MIGFRSEPNDNFWGIPDFVRFLDYLSPQQ